MTQQKLNFKIKLLEEDSILFYLSVNDNTSTIICLKFKKKWYGNSLTQIVKSLLSELGI